MLLQVVLLVIAVVALLVAAMTWSKHRTTINRVYRMCRDATLPVPKPKESS